MEIRDYIWELIESRRDNVQDFSPSIVFYLLYIIRIKFEHYDQNPFIDEITEDKKKSSTCWSSKLKWKCIAVVYVFLLLFPCSLLSLTLLWAVSVFYTGNIEQNHRFPIYRGSGTSYSETFKYRIIRHDLNYFNGTDSCIVMLTILAVHTNRAKQFSSWKIYRYIHRFAHFLKKNWKIL